VPRAAHPEAGGSKTVPVLADLGGPNYHGDNVLVESYTPFLRAQAWLPGAQVTYHQGCTVASNDTSGFDAAIAAATAADAVVLFLGLDDSIENEGHDRSSLELPGVQMELALKVASAAASPVVVVLVNGGPVAIKQLKESPHVGAILEAFMPGQFAAEAITQQLLGQASPSGLMPVTTYDADFIDARGPITNLDLRGAGGVTYRYFEGVPLWPFGFGLSYADIEFRAANASAVLHTTVAAAEAGAPLCFGVLVQSAKRSAMAADVVVLGFVSSAHDDAPRNSRLCDFVREAALQPGAQARELSLCVNAALPLVNDAGEERVLRGTYTATVGVKGGVGGAGAGSVIGSVVVA